MKLSARLLFSFLLFFFIFFGLTQSTYAQSINQAPQNSYNAPNTNPDVPPRNPATTGNVVGTFQPQADYVPKNLHTYTQSVMLEVASGLSCLIAGVDPVNPNGECLGFDPQTKKIGYMKSGGGAIGTMENLIAMTFTPPLHTSDYFQNLAQNFGLSKQTYAVLYDTGGDRGATTPVNQNGMGFQGLSPLLKIWEAFRNIAYLLFVLVFIIIGIAIMLRVKIDPRTVMAIQNQIPKLIIGILLVTFSFAIAGFLIDIMWVAIYLFYGIFEGIKGADISSLSPQNIQGVSPINAAGGLGGIGSIAHNVSGSISNVISSLFDNTWGRLIAGAIGGILGTGVGGVLGTVGKVLKPGAQAAGGANPVAMGFSALSIGVGIAAGFLAGSKLLAVVGGAVAFIIISIALLWALFRVWFALLSAYIMILIDIVFAPFWIVAGLFPGSKISFNTWLRDIVANLAAFPAVLVMFLLGKTFMDAFATKFPVGQFVPPFIGNPGDYKAFGSLIGLGIILTIPNVVKMIKTALNAPQMDLSSIGAAVGAGVGVAMAGPRAVGQYFRTPKMGERQGLGGIVRGIFGMS